MRVIVHWKSDSMHYTRCVFVEIAAGCSGPDRGRSAEQAAHCRNHGHRFVCIFMAFCVNWNGVTLRLMGTRLSHQASNHNRALYQSN